MQNRQQSILQFLQERGRDTTVSTIETRLKMDRTAVRYELEILAHVGHVAVNRDICGKITSATIRQTGKQVI